MTAWSILEANSTAPAGSTAWVHLNNQKSGTGTGTGTIVHEQFNACLEEDIAVSIFQPEEIQVVLEEISVVVEESEILVTDEQIQADI